MDRNPHPSSGEQAARFTLFAPLAIFLLALLTQIARERYVFTASIVCLNAVLGIATFTLGIFALFSMRSSGRRGILGRVAGGFLLNVLALALTAQLTIPIIQLGRLREHVVGHWRMQSANSHSDYTFNDDGTFRLETSWGELAPITVDGHWILTPARTIALVGGPSATAKNGLGTVKSVDDQHLVLATERGDEAYMRVP